MSSRRDSAYCDSSSLPYSNNIYGNSHIRRTNSDCLPSQNPYQLCSDMDQLRIHSCDNLPRCTDRRIDQNSAHSNCGSHFERRPSCCEGSSVCCSSHNCRVPVDPGGGKLNFYKNYVTFLFLNNVFIFLVLK